jgi:hypothetical protein
MRFNPAGAVYGTIAVGALLAAESATRETYAETVGAVVITLVVYWLAHAYAQFTGRRLERGEPLALAALTRSLAHELAILAGAAIPLIPLIGWWIAGGKLADAVTAAIGTSAALIVVIELIAGIRAELSGRELLKQTSFGALLGLLVITLKLVLH